MAERHSLSRMQESCIGRQSDIRRRLSQQPVAVEEEQVEEMADQQEDVQQMERQLLEAQKVEEGLQKTIEAQNMDYEMFDQRLQEMSEGWKEKMKQAQYHYAMAESVAKKNIDELETMYAEVKDEFDNKMSDVCRLKTLKQDLRIIVNELFEEADQTPFLELEDQIEAAQKENCGLARQLNDAAKLNAQLLSEQQRVDVYRDALNQSEAIQNTEVVELESTKQSIEEENQGLQCQIANLPTDQRALCESAGKEYEELDGRNRALGEENSALQRVLKERDLKITATQLRIFLLLAQIQKHGLDINIDEQNCNG